MRKFILQITIMILGYSYSYAQLPNTDPLYQPIFVENFNAPLDSNHWRVNYPWSSGNFLGIDTGRIWLGGVVDLASMDKYVADTSNYRISGGTCKLMGKNQPNTGVSWKFYPYPSSDCSNLGLGPVAWDNNYCLQETPVQYKYSNSMLFSQDKFKYGFFEIKFRIPNWSASTNYRTCPTFWMYDRTSTMPWSEIDVFEIQGIDGKFKSTIYVDAAYDSNPYAASDGIPFNAAPSINLSQWHKAAVNWSPTFIDFYLDDTLRYHSVADTNKYLIPMPLIIENQITSLAYWTGNLNPNNVTWPLTYEIDYVSVHQLKQACDTAKTYLNTTQALFNSKLYKSLTIGGSGGTATFNNSVARAVASDYVLLNEGLEVGNNMDMLFDLQTCWSTQSYLPKAVVPTVPPPNFIKTYTKNKNQ